jgi:hypothetical protein
MFADVILLFNINKTINKDTFNNQIHKKSEVFFIKLLLLTSHEP